MKELNWKWKPALYYCPVCHRWINDSTVTGDQVHERSRGGCGCFVMTQAEVRELSTGAASHG